MRGRTLALVALPVIVGGAAIAYGVAGAVVYDDVSKVKADCGGRFAAFTPASFQAIRDDGGAVAPELDLGIVEPYLMPDYETVSIPSRDPRITVSAWFVPAAQPANGMAVVLVHGYGSCKRDPVVLLPAGMLHRNGFAVLLVDLRDSGDSTIEDGRWAGGTDEFQDVLGAWDWLVAAKGFHPRQIGLFGASLGAGSAMIALGEEPAVAAVWEDSGYSNIEVAIGEELAYRGYPTWLEPAGILMARLISGDDLTSRSPEKAVQRLAGRPFAIVHGDADPRVRTHHAFDLASVAREGGVTVEPWIIPGPGHTVGMFLVPDEYERRLSEFFSESLRQAGQDPSSSSTTPSARRLRISATSSAS